MACSRVKRRALSMATAARAASSSANARSSSSKHPVDCERQKLTMPRTTPRARNGTETREWMP